MPGPPPKPTALKIAEGNPGNRPLAAAEPSPAAGAVMPEGLSPDAAAVWDKFAPRFVAMGLLTELDAPAFAVLCTSWAAWLDLMARAAEQEPVIVLNGQPVPNPYLVRADKEATKLQKLLAEFGATPASRTRLRVDADDTPEALDDFLGAA